MIMMMLEVNYKNRYNHHKYEDNKSIPPCRLSHSRCCY